MPDTPTPPPSPTTGDSPAQDGWRPDLAKLRARLDAIDDQLHDLLMVRAEVVEGVARSGKAAAFRPGREASILRRLLARHTGQLPARTLVRMWREMLAGTTGMQTAVTASVFDPTPDGAVAAVAREHFGFLTPTRALPTLPAALETVRAARATVAVIPFPADAAAWRALTEAAAERRAPALHIIARLPFWADRPADVPAADALVIATAAPDASGADRSFLALAGIPDRAALADAGLTLHAAHGTVAEVEGMVTADDPRLPPGAAALGGYAIPVAGENA